MADVKLSIFGLLLCVISVRSELVHVVTAERIDSEQHDQQQQQTNATTSPEIASVPQYKRESPLSGPVDSYLAALRHSHGASSRYDPPSAPPETSYGPAHDHEYESYNDPKQDNTYGPPQGYQPTKPSYHVPHPTPPVPYGPPAPMYLPPQQPPSYGMPYAAPTDLIGGILKSLLPKGLDLETICKLLLKLTLFKLIVKFIAVICILLAAPLFQSKEKPMEDDEEEEDRQFGALNDLTALVWSGIDKFSGSTAEEKNDDDDDIVEKVAGEIDDKMATPTEEMTIKFLEFCVSVANMAIGWMTSMVRRRNHEMDPIEQLLWSIWERIKSAFYTSMTTAK